MPRLQQEMVINPDYLVFSNIIFFGRPVYTTIQFCYYSPQKFFKRRHNKRLIKKWCKRYGTTHKPRTDANIYDKMVVCHPDTLWRFKPENFASDTESSASGSLKHDIHM